MRAPEFLDRHRFSRTLKEAPFDQVRKEYRRNNGKDLVICRWCGGEVPPRRQTWCSDECVHEFRLRSDVGYARQKVLERDRGICSRCGHDATTTLRMIEESQYFYALFGLCKCAVVNRWSTGGSSFSFLTDPRFQKRCPCPSCQARPLGRWEMNHILPVVEGGGCCAIDNLETLCMACHKTHTRELARRRARSRAR